MEEGAEKCALRDLRREEETSAVGYNDVSVWIPKVIHNRKSASSRVLHQNPPFDRGMWDTSNADRTDVLHTGVVLHFERGFLEDGGHDEGMTTTREWDNVIPTVNIGGSRAQWNLGLCPTVSTLTPHPQWLTTEYVQQS